MGALTLEPRLHEAAEWVIGNLNEDGYLAASEEELAAEFREAGDAAGEPAGQAVAPDAAIDLVRRAIDLVQHLDPAGVGARDLRECLMIQIAAQQAEFGHLYSGKAVEPAQAEADDPHRSFRAEADAQLEARRRSSILRSASS